MKRIHYILLVFLSTLSGICQDKTSTLTSDSLDTFSYKRLITKFDKVLDNNNTLARLYGKKYLQKGKKENNVVEIGVGYSLMSYTYDTLAYRMVYLDSAITISKNLQHKEYPALFYINKGGAYEETGDLKKAIDNYLIALDWIKKSNNEQLEFVTKHNIGFLKRRLEKYEEAKLLFKSCLLYETSKKKMSVNDSLGYLQTLSELVNTYRLNKEIDSASSYNKEGLQSSKGKGIYYLFKLNEVVLHYYQENYKGVITGSHNLLEKKLIPESTYFIKTLDFTNLYLYQGKSYEALNNREKAIESYKKIDSILETWNYVIPETKIIYKNLIDYYKTIDDKNQQLFYINKLLRSDSILDSNYKYLSNKLVVEYDTPELLLQKQELIESLETQQSGLYKGVIILVLILVISVILLLLFYKRQRMYRQRFEDLFIAKEEVLKPKNVKKQVSDLSSSFIDIPEDVVHTVLNNLETFEKKNGFLKININVSELANITKTNSKYVSKIINTHKNKNFIHYINDLRIEFIVEKLKNDIKYRKFTIKALAGESGFNTTEAFSKSFYKKTGIYPSYFIKQLTKNENKI